MVKKDAQSLELQADDDVDYTNNEAVEKTEYNMNC